MEPEVARQDEVELFIEEDVRAKSNRHVEVRMFCRALQEGSGTQRVGDAQLPKEWVTLSDPPKGCQGGLLVDRCVVGRGLCSGTAKHRSARRRGSSGMTD